MIIMLLLMMSILTSCSTKDSQERERSTIPTSYLEVPGITQDEIDAIQRLQETHSSLIYGVTPSIEAFYDQEGTVRGYSALFSAWFSEFFGISLVPHILQWNDIMAGVQQGGIDFVDLAITETRLKDYDFSEPISNRKLILIRTQDSLPLDVITRSRKVKLAFIDDSISMKRAIEQLEPGSFEAFVVPNYDIAQEKLQEGVVDAFIILNIAESFFASAEDYTIEDFLPLTFVSVSLATANPELSELLQVLNRALGTGVSAELRELYHVGYEQYRVNRVHTRLSQEEQEFIRSHSVIPFAAQSFNYPVSFYNTFREEWEGIAFDVLDEVSKLTGLTFTIANTQDHTWSDLLEMVEQGEAYFVPDLIQTTDRMGKFLWPDIDFLYDQYALISKWDFPNIKINDILDARIGLVKDTAFKEMFLHWFPDASNTNVYLTTKDAFYALDSGEIDLVMTGKSRLLALTNYYELAGYKANYIFKETIESTFGFHKEQEVLVSIFNKTLPLVNTDQIVSQWQSKTHDYQLQLSRSRIPLLTIIISLLIVVVVLIFVFYMRTKMYQKRLKHLVTEKTGELEYQNAKLDAILNTIPDLIFCKDLESKFIQVNQSFETYFQVTEEEILGKRDEEALGIPPEIAEEYRKNDKLVMYSNMINMNEEMIPSRNGEMRSFETLKSPLVQNQTVIGLLAISRDITNRKELEEKTKQANEYKTRYLATMSHEMRTPLSTIIGLLGLVIDDMEVSVDVYDILQKIMSASENLLSIVNDVLDISKIETGKLSILPVQYNLASLLNDIIIINIVRIESKPIEFIIDIDPNLPSVLYGDDLRVKQIFNNLLSNAFKYTRQGRVCLKVTYETLDQDRILLKVMITDTGIGIKKEDVQTLFRDYNQVNVNANREIEGTGLGLAITKNIVTMMDGQVQVESEFGHGSTFTVQIVQEVVEEVPLGEEIVDSLKQYRFVDLKRRKRKKLVRKDYSKYSVLVVDDVKTNLVVAAALLMQYKIHVDAVLSGEEAIEKIKTGTHYDLIFMDHMMPVMDGIEAFERIRVLEEDSTRHTPVIALTANAIQGSERMFLDKGFAGYLSKPIDILKLDEILRNYLSSV